MNGSDANVSDKLKKYLLSAKVHTLSSVLSMVKRDMYKLLTEYMDLTGDIRITADLDESGNEVLFHVDFSADEVYDAGSLLSDSLDKNQA